MRRRRISVSAVVIAATASTWIGVTNAGTSAAYATTSSESSYAARLAQLVNQARSQQGVRPLTVTTGTTYVAASWTAHLAARQTLSHNPNLVPDVERHGSANATFVAENVGQGSSTNPDGLFNAYMNSPDHRTNILDSRVRYLGIAVDFTGSSAWNTMDFVNVYGTRTATQATASHPVGVAPRHARTTHRSTATRSVATKRVVAPRAVPVKVVPTKSQPRSMVATDSAGTYAQTSINVASTARHFPAAPAAVAVLLILGLVIGHLRARKLTLIP
jgi:uncharacterized protein YkwD